MINQHKHVLVLIITLLVLTGMGSGVATGQEPGQPFRALLTGEVYQQRLQSALSGMPSVASLEASSMPVSGVRVDGVVPGYQAEGLGIEADDVIVSVDDQRTWARWIDWKRTGQAQTLRLVTRNGKERSVQVQPGLVGVQYYSYRRPDLAYIRRADRNKELDELVLVGLMMRGQDPDLAETAWHHAIRAGYEPDDLSDACLAVIAREQSRFDDAIGAAMRVPAIDAEHPYRLDPSEVTKIALPRGRFDMLLALDPQLHASWGLEPDRLTSLVQRMQDAGGAGVSPIAAAAKMKRVDLMESAIVMNDPALNTGGDDFGLLTDGAGTMSRPQGNFTNCYLGFRRPSKDMEMVIRFTMTAPPKRTQWANIFDVKLVDRDYRRRHGIDMRKMQTLELRYRATNLGLGIERDEEGQAKTEIVFGNPPQGLWSDAPDIDLTGPATFEVRIVKVGGFAEMQVNGETVALTPVLEPTENHGIFLMVVGTHVEIHEIEANALE